MKLKIIFAVTAILLTNAGFAQFVSSNLPIIVIETNGGTIADEPKINVNFKVLHRTDGTPNFLTDAVAHYNGFAGIEFRGSSSLGFPKKSYSIELRNAAGNDVEFAVFGFSKEADWVLVANYDDPTHLKNTYMYNLWAKNSRYSPRFKHVEVVINGQYMGLFVFTEKIKRGANRVDVKKLEATDTTVARISGGYIIEGTREVDTLATPYAWISPYASSPSSGYLMSFDCQYPKAPVPKQLNYIKNYIDDFEDALKSNDFKDPVLGFRKYVDENSFVDNFVLQEYSIHYDIFARSQYFFKDRGGKLIASPIWDNNPGLFDNYATSWRFSCGACDPRFFWAERMMQDCDFKAKVIAKYRDFRRTFLTVAKGHAFVDSLSNIIRFAVARDINKWFLSSGINFSNETGKLKNFISVRTNWLDLNIHNIMNDGENLATTSTEATHNQSVTLISGCTNTNPITWRADFADGTNFVFTATNTTQVLITQNVTYTAICQVNDCTRYSNRVAITFIGNCLDNQNFTSHPSTPSPQIYEAKDTISSTSALNSSSKLTYSSGKAIRLGPGFSVSQGSVFRANIRGCQ